MLQGDAKKSASDWKWFRNVVVFLEEEKIRFYPRYKREGLRTVEDPARWWTSILQVNTKSDLRAHHFHEV